MIKRATAEVYRHFFQETEQGQQILNDLASRYYDTNIIGEDSNETYFNLGSREVVAFILRQCAIVDTSKEDEIEPYGEPDN